MNFMRIFCLKPSSLQKALNVEHFLLVLNSICWKNKSFPYVICLVGLNNISNIFIYYSIHFIFCLVQHSVYVHCLGTAFQFCECAQKKSLAKNKPTSESKKKSVCAKLCVWEYVQHTLNHFSHEISIKSNTKWFSKIKIITYQNFVFF